MTTHTAPLSSCSIDGVRTVHSAPPRWFRRLWRHLRSAAAGVDAAARIAHGFEVPSEHPARRREHDRIELERRLTTRFPRT